MSCSFPFQVWISAWRAAQTFQVFQRGCPQDQKKELCKHPKAPTSSWSLSSAAVRSTCTKTTHRLVGISSLRVHLGSGALQTANFRDKDNAIMSDFCTELNFICSWNNHEVQQDSDRNEKRWLLWQPLWSNVLKADIHEFTSPELQRRHPSATLITQTRASQAKVNVLNVTSLVFYSRPLLIWTAANWTGVHLYLLSCP